MITIIYLSTPEPRFSDHGRGCSSIALSICGFRDCKRSSSVVILDCLDVFCNDKVSKRLSAQSDHRSGTLGLAGHPVDSAQSEHAVSGGNILCQSPVGLARLAPGDRVVASLVQVPNCLSHLAINGTCGVR